MFAILGVEGNKSWRVKTTNTSGNTITITPVVSQIYILKLMLYGRSL